MTFEHRAGIIPYTSSFELAENCVFSKQSVGPLHCGQPSLSRELALLLANVRSEFAEFLNQSSLAHLRILSSPTCVGYQYGISRRYLSTGFSRHRDIECSYRSRRLHTNESAPSLSKGQSRWCRGPTCRPSILVVCVLREHL